MSQKNESRVEENASRVEKNGSRVEENDSRVEKTGRVKKIGSQIGKDWVAGQKIRVKKQSVHSKSPPSLF